MSRSGTNPTIETVSPAAGSGFATEATLQEVEEDLDLISTAQIDGTQQTQITGGGAGGVAAIAMRTDGIRALEVNDDFTSFEAIHQTLSANVDTLVLFSQNVRIIRVLNWDTSNRVLLKDGVISSNTDSTASRIGKAPTTDVPAARWMPFKTVAIHLRSAAASEVTVEGYF